MVSAQLYIRIPQILEYTKELYLVRIEQTMNINILICNSDYRYIEALASGRYLENMFNLIGWLYVCPKGIKRLVALYQRNVQECF